jgi:hypothetical protein
VTVTAQLELFGGGDAVPAPELRRGIPIGAERLLAELVRRGLHEEDLHVAALLALELDRGGQK